MTESVADCRPIPFFISAAIASVLLAVAGFAIPDGLAAGPLGADAVRHLLGFIGATMLLMAYVDGLRSRCIRSYVSIVMPIFALGCMVPLIGQEPAQWSTTQQQAMNLVLATMLLFGLLHFALHMLPTDWRQRLTPLSTGLIGVIGALIWMLVQARNQVEPLSEQLVMIGVDIGGVLIGAVLFLVLMRHRGTGMPASAP